MNSVDHFILLDDVKYINKGWINRNRILLNGKPYNFTIPIANKSQNKNICELTTKIDKKFLKKIFSTLKHAYGKSLFFEEVFYNLVAPIISYEEENLAKFIKNSIDMISKYTDINCRISSSLDFQNKSLFSGQQRIIDLCIRNKCTTYINLIGGKSIYSSCEFKKFGIALYFLEPRLDLYQQLSDHHNRFTPSLSILDVLFNCNKIQVKNIIASGNAP